VILFDGFLKVYMEGKDDEDSEEQEGLLPDMKQGEGLGLRECSPPNVSIALRRATRKPAW
jgi:DNA topoisomerase IA